MDGAPNFSWVIEGKLAGLARPHTDGALATLHTLGVRATVSLTETPLPAGALTRHDLDSVHLPVADFTAPSPELIDQAIAAIDTWLARDMPVAVHCAGGMGRTGTILACYLIHRGDDAPTAIATVRALRPGSIETLDQEAAVAAYARRVR